MFKASRIITPTHLIRYFASLCRDLDTNEHPLLITRKDGQHMVLVAADLYEELMEAKMHLMKIEHENNR